MTATGFKLRLQLLCDGEIAIGPGKADLLDAIAECGSISAAGRRLGYSYRRTWLLIDTMNRCWREPLVATVHGGAKGGGASLTPLGERVAAQYRAVEAAAHDAAVVAGRRLADELLDRPRPKR
ncbi:winged helix-turn-helix domain-containing protein [Glacieibacterium frigidum]|uniref:LysR family transcriptional regulator n=1 Tax=Glacieibacterium frigidum TaxID=2593303 RepID=A0A552U759_9SPHN|nr:LysR family transcriptional regulator [Glacieibacterium frigidum]TRW14050.1 LysR family transcriptional regulator [Glacieibacterium frigidum]